MSDQCKCDFCESGDWVEEVDDDIDDDDLEINPEDDD